MSITTVQAEYDSTLRSRPDNTGDLPGPLLSVIVPVFNEADTIAMMIRRVLATPYKKEVIIVDDGSTDATYAVLETLRDPQIRIVRHPKNCGKGAAIRSALTIATGRVAIIQDADLEYDPHDYEKVIAPILAGRAAVVYGSRYLITIDQPDTSRHSQQYRPGVRHYAGRRVMDRGVRFLNFAARFLYGIRLSDIATCYKALPVALLRAMDLQCQKFEFCEEVTAKLSRMKIQILEVPIQYHPRDFAHGKKIRIKDGWKALLELWKWHRWKHECLTDWTIASPSGVQTSIAKVSATKVEVS